MEDLRAFIKYKGTPQYKLADAIGMTAATLSRKLDERRFTEEEIEDIAKYYDVPIEEIYSYIEKPEYENIVNNSESLTRGVKEPTVLYGVMRIREYTAGAGGPQKSLGQFSPQIDENDLLHGSETRRIEIEVGDNTTKYAKGNWVRAAEDKLYEGKYYVLFTNEGVLLKYVKKVDRLNNIVVLGCETLPDKEIGLEDVDNTFRVYGSIEWE